MKTKHIHRLQKHKYTNGTTIFFCTLPDCMFKAEAVLALGKETLCHVCNEPFILTERSMKLKRPHCNNCGKVKVKDTDGNNRYISKRNGSLTTGLSSVTFEIATDSINDLKSKLQNTSNSGNGSGEMEIEDTEGDL